MKKQILFLILSIILGGTVLISCEKETLPLQNSIKNFEYDQFSVVDERLVFEDEVAFRKTLDDLYLSQEKLDVWENGIADYTSMRTYFETLAEIDSEDLMNNLQEYMFTFTLIEEEDGMKSMERNIYNDVIATLINKDGFMQIGKTVYRFTYDYFYSTDVSNISLLTSKSIDPRNTLVEITKINREFIFNDSNDGTGTNRYLTGECTKTSGSYRVKGQIIREEIFDNDCIIKTKHQRKRFGVWWANKTQISVSYSGNFVKLFSSCNPVPKPYFASSGYSGNSSSITRTIQGNHSSWNGCNGEVTPFHDGLYESTHSAGGKTCILHCPPGVPCN